MHFYSVGECPFELKKIKLFLMTNIYYVNVCIS